MPRIESGALVWLCAACLGFWVVLGQSQAAFAGASYRGNWDTKEDEAGRLLQSNNNLLGVDFSQHLSERLTSREKVSYNTRWEERGPDRETLSPGASLLLSGELFEAGLAVDSLMEKLDEGASADTDTLGLTWSSRWETRWVPALRANYDNRRRRTDVNRLEVQDNSDSLGGEVSWDLTPVELFYAYRREQNVNTFSELDQTSHLATFKFSRSWLANRLSVTLGHEYHESRNERLVPFASSNTVSIDLSLSEVRIGTDPFPDDIDDSMLSSSFSMRDGNLLLPAYSPAPGSSNNSVLLVTNGQQVNNLYLYTLNNLGPAPPGLTWRVYSNDLLTTTWDPVPAPVVTYDTTNQRFLLVLPAVTAPYLKVVVDMDVVAPPLDFTEVKVEQILTGTVGSGLLFLSEDQSNKSNFSLDYRLNQGLVLFYNFFMEQSESSNLTLDDRETHGGGLRMQNSGGDLKSVLAYSLSRQIPQNRQEIQSESYRLNINNMVLPTLTLALSGSHDLTSMAGTPTSERDSYSFYADAQLYPDLNSRLEVIYWESESYLSGGRSSFADSLRTQVLLTSRFRPSLTISLIETYELQDNDGKYSLNQNTTALSGSWQLSEWLALQVSAENVDSKIIQDRYSYSVNARVGFGAGFELNLSYAVQTAELTSQSGSLRLRSSGNKKLSWEIGCSYAESEAGAVQNVYKFFSRVILQFATS